MATAIIDYLSFTIPAWDREETDASTHSGGINRLWHELGADLPEMLFDEYRWEVIGYRRPYRFSVRNADCGCSIFSGGQDTVLIEFSGQGCRWLAEHGVDFALVERVHSRMTRIDFAVDMPHVDNLLEFANNRSNQRIRSVAHIVSDSGETVYLGSENSDRFCRIYEYAAPHERSGTTRVEIVLRRELAKGAAWMLLQRGLLDAVQAQANSYGFYSLPALSVFDGVASAPRKTRQNSGTELWLIKQAMPALARLHKEREIANLEQWLLEHLYSKL